MTPYGLLNGQKLNVKGLHPWGCKVHMHDIDGTKLEGRSKVGCWLGFDPETKDSHHIYWPDQCSVSVERSVRFNFNNNMVVWVLPLEGESSDGSQSNTLTNEHISPNLQTGTTPTNDGNLNVVENPDNTKSLEPVGGEESTFEKNLNMYECSRMAQR